METTDQSDAADPVTGRIGLLAGWQLAATGVVTALLVLNAVVLVRNGLRVEGSVLVFAADGLVTLLLGGVLVCGAILAAVRSSIRGHLLWLGTLGYVVYAAVRTVTDPIHVGESVVTLAALVVFSASLFPLLVGLIECPVEDAARTLSGLPRRLLAGALGLLAAVLASVLVLDVVVGVLVAAFENSRIARPMPVPPGTLLLEGGVLVPGLAASAWLVWQDRPVGYVLSSIQLVTLVGVAALAVALGVAGWFDLPNTPSSVRTLGFLVVGTGAGALVAVLLSPIGTAEAGRNWPSSTSAEE